MLSRQVPSGKQQGLVTGGVLDAEIIAVTKMSDMPLNIHRRPHKLIDQILLPKPNGKPFDIFDPLC